MSIELLPLAKVCPQKCTYCYQTNERVATNNEADPYDMDSMKAALKSEGVGKGNSWTLFGGEPLMLPIKDYEELLKWNKEQGAPAPGTQTSGWLCTDKHFELWKHYGCSVGFSIDGPGELNDARSMGSEEATRNTTAKSIRNLERCLEEGIPASLITTIHRINADTDDKVSALIAWMLSLRDKGLKYVNLHTLEPHGDDLSIPQDVQIRVMRRLRKELVGFVTVSPFDDMRKALLQTGDSNCIWNFCDPLTTPAVRGVNGQGESGNCGRTNERGVGWIKSDRSGHERQLALYLTPQQYGGCQGCIHFVACGGGNCPGEGENGDWRNRTVHCQTIYALLDDIAQELGVAGKDPISYSLRRAAVEAQLFAQWTGTVSNVFADRPHGDVAHGDHTDAERPVIINSEGVRIQ